MKKLLNKTYNWEECYDLERDISESIPKGEFKGKKSTGKPVSYSGVTVSRIKNNQIFEYWAYLDMQRLLSQIE